jgi:septal ring factor EnvC (AmiA/AmiB activator)
MEPVWVMNTRQIDIMSKQIYEQNARINELHQSMVLLGSQLQQTQMHVNVIDSRVPSYKKVLRQLSAAVDKINELMGRSPSAQVEEEQIALGDFVAIDMEMAIPDLLASDLKLCDCSCNDLCAECFV